MFIAIPFKLYLQNAVALVTGGARGLGRAAAVKFIASGSRVILCDLPKSIGAKVANKLGDNAIFVPTDVTSTKDIENAMNVAQEKFGRLDIAVNCAQIVVKGSIYDTIKDIHFSLDDFKRMLQVCSIRI